MPHLVVEHSTEGHGGAFDAKSLMEALHDAAAATGVMHAADIKIRAMPYADHLLARKRDGFCHLWVHMLEGRTPEQKVVVSEALRVVMVRLLPHTKSLSVDIRDMDTVAYKKRLND